MKKHIKAKLTNYIRCNLKRCRKMKKYSGTDSVEELLNKMKKGEQLSVSEMAYVKIFANLSDYERAEKSNYIKTIFMQK